MAYVVGQLIGPISYYDFWHWWMKMHLGVCEPFFVLSTLANEDITSTAPGPYPPRLSRRRPLLHPPAVEVIGLTQGLIVMLSI